MVTRTLLIDAPAAVQAGDEPALPPLRRSECVPEDLLDLLPPPQAVSRAPNWAQVTRVQTALRLRSREIEAIFG